VKNRTIVLLFIGLIIISVALAMRLPTDPAILTHYSITQTKARLLNLTIIIPQIFIWLSALYGYVRFKIYAHLVSDGPEGAPLHMIANALLVLAFYMPISSVVSTVTSYLVLSNPQYIPSSAIIRNYLTMLFTVIAFLMLAKGSQKLLQNFKLSDKQTPLVNKYRSLLLILLTSAFNWLIITRPLNQQNGASIYYLPSYLIILTLAVPYIYAWYEGLLAAARLYLYVKKVRGIVYKQAFDSLAKGLGIVVLVSIVIQFINTLSARLNRLNLTPLLLVIYVLLILYAVGFGFIARGAEKLKQIEEA
jgi:hypothetical protein